MNLPAIVVPEEGGGQLRASHADRGQAIEVLKAAFVRERLAKAEFEMRVGQALASRTYADLAAVTDDIPTRLVAGQPASTPDLIREQRIQRQMSQADLAEALGASRQTVSLIESGRYLPSLPLAFAIARFFGLTVDTMFGPAEEPVAVPRCRRAGRGYGSFCVCLGHGDGEVSVDRRPGLPAGRGHRCDWLAWWPPAG